ncbi:hypothetical protein GCM10028803_23490 [Larkinella knui]|uniref:Uncharacterized protein n=1 Tax=Larkinella knui TaxID=2025310 RepID=A0A3P1CX18_9BACT|nr:hypothetical protein [Larkinella knui]RRB17414.1 hypothetical protein EHT87_03780 [Larkinella knui]
MRVLKVTKYSPILHELRASWGVLQAGKYLLAESMQNRIPQEDLFAYQNAIAEIGRIERKLDILYDEIQAVELLHQAAILVGNYEDMSGRKRSNGNTSLN